MASPTKAEPVEIVPVSSASAWPRIIAGIVVLAGTIWSYWPTITTMVGAWEREADYSHGYLVAPMALLFLWFTRSSRPAVAGPAWLWGLLLIGCSLFLRTFSAV